jgi:6,7-dimethyl-8-ribityllumazine synthase
VTEHEAWPGEEPLDEAEPEELADDADELEEADAEPGEDDALDEQPRLRVAHAHVSGELDVPDEIDLLEGEARSARRGVGIVAARPNVDVVNRLLASALEELERAGVASDSVTVMAVPGAFELALGAMALAKTRRYSCIVALGCIVRDETPEFEYVAGEAASGLQLAALETGVPVSFGVLTVDSLAQAEARVAKGAESARNALEMADLFAQLRAAAQAQ